MPISQTNPDIALGTSSMPGTAISGSDTPRYKSPLYDEMADRWVVCRDLMTGTEAIRNSSTSYLPQHPAEDDDEYQLRVARTECFPGFQHSVKGLVGIVYRDDPELQPDVPVEIREDHWENIDGAGQHGAIFTKNVFEDALTAGHSLILVDMPRAPNIGRQLSMAEERQLGLRPFWVHIYPEQVYSWRTKIIAGVVTLTQIVIHEQVTEPAGDFADAVVARFRVFRYDETTGLVSFQIWMEESVGGNPMLVDEGVLSGVNRIPISVCYGGFRRGPLHSFPPLYDLAFANIAHTQVLADHRYALYLASVPLLVFVGRPAQQRIDPNTGEQIRTAVGPNVAIDVPIDGDVKYVEHSGNALGQTRAELKDLETRMATLGLSMLQHETRAAETAEAKRIDKTEKDATISTAARSLIDCIESCLDFHAQYLGHAPGEGGSCFIDLDFSVEAMDAVTIDSYSKAVSAGQLSLQAMWEIMKNRGALPEDFDEELEQERISAATITTGLTIPTGGANPGPQAGDQPPIAVPPTQG